MRRMAKPRNARRNPLLRTILFGLGVALIVAAPLVGVIPGPGGILVFAAGLVLVLRNSHWARRNFVRWKHRWPRFGKLADRALQRRSAHRRRLRAREAAR
jgi:hypothetical protein